jgi:hypothetical protein
MFLVKPSSPLFLSLSVVYLEGIHCIIEKG